jgi:hypothetical protein
MAGLLSAVWLGVWCFACQRLQKDKRRRLVSLKLVLQQLLEALDTAHATGIGERLWLPFLCICLPFKSSGVRRCLVLQVMWLAESL